MSFDLDGRVTRLAIAILAITFIFEFGACNRKGPSSSQNKEIGEGVAPLWEYSVIHSFSGPDGASPMAALTEGPDGSLYGTTAGGGASGNGTVFKIDPAGSLTVLHSFIRSEGGAPGKLVLAKDGYFYGITPFGSATIFKINVSGNFKTLHSFSNLEGDLLTALIQAKDGTFYGTAETGGASGKGTMFKMDASGKVTVLYSFGGELPENPEGGLIQASDGSFYGTTYNTIFKVDANRNLTVVHSFDLKGGRDESLVQGHDGDFYGIVGGGEAGGNTFYRMDTSGNVTFVHAFSRPDGEDPSGGLIQANEGNFCGTTVRGGAGAVEGGYVGDGTVFTIDLVGNLKVLHSFNGKDGAIPVGLLQAKDGSLYGLTNAGGPHNLGVVFRLIRRH